MFHVNYTSFRYFLTSPCVNLHSAGAEKRIVTDLFLSNYYIFNRYLLAWAFHMKDLHPSKLSHKDVSSSIQEYEFLKLVTSVHYSILYKPSPPPPPRYKQPSCMYLTEFDFYNVFKLKKVSRCKKYFNQHCYRQ